MIYLGYALLVVVSLFAVLVIFGFISRAKEKKLQRQLVEAYNATNYAEMRKVVLALEKMGSKILLTLEVTAKEQHEAEEAGINILVDSTYVGMMQGMGLVMPDRLPCHISSIEK
jgi:hypothetical protein